MSSRQEMFDGLFPQKQDRMVSIKEASNWASRKLNRNISKSNIAYLVQYGQIRTLNRQGVTLINLDELQQYYSERFNERESDWKQRLGDDLNWLLSFEHLRETDTTKHVHRLHPYKGKFIPQLVQYFLDDHTDEFKTKCYFSPGDVVLDPFAGSGTTLVQAGELGIHSIGVDISTFNCMIIEVKVGKYDLLSLHREVDHAKLELSKFCLESNIGAFESEIKTQLAEFNKVYFPNPEFRQQIRLNQIDEAEYVAEKELEFIKIQNQIVSAHGIQLQQNRSQTFLDRWYSQNIRNEIDFIHKHIKLIDNPSIRKVLQLILSRTIRSCRATTHFDLATLKEPQFSAYYCWKHKKICKPVNSIKYWFNRYSKDTITRLHQYGQLRSSTSSAVVTADARTVDIFSEVAQLNPVLFNEIRNRKIQGIFSSPPYVGQIDYHEQHAYAYELFELERFDDSEIGPLYKGQGLAAKESYIKGISDVLLNCRQYLTPDADIFLVANDKHNLYPLIAERSNTQIVNFFKRPVLNRTERDKSPYSEKIFHLKYRE